MKDFEKFPRSLPRFAIDPDRPRETIGQYWHRLEKKIQGQPGGPFTFCFIDAVSEKAVEHTGSAQIMAGEFETEIQSFRAQPFDHVLMAEALLDIACDSYRANLPEPARSHYVARIERAIAVLRGEDP